MNLTVLLDNNTIIDRYFLGEPAVSYLIEDNGTRILFDVGYSDAFLQNAYRMKIDLLDLDHIVLSHGHLDHTWGLDSIVRLFTEAKIEGLVHSEPTVVGHPLVFNSKTYAGLNEIGSIIGAEKLSRIFKLELSRVPLWLTKSIVFLGEIPRIFDFELESLESKVIIHGKEEEEDKLSDDTAIAIKTENGLVIITGCSHSGICNIIEYAKSVCNENRVVDVIGGFHLLQPPEAKISRTVDYFNKLNVREVHACHCTDLMSKIALSKVCNLKEVGSGLRLEY
ncbi:MAG: MBL fold metallo-hydrolase [Methanolobus sp.]|nr:MBL fold metallo-hydrolase [Methanolobus sp.]